MLSRQHILLLLELLFGLISCDFEIPLCIVPGVMICSFICGTHIFMYICIGAFTGASQKLVRAWFRFLFLNSFDGLRFGCCLSRGYRVVFFYIFVLWKNERIDFFI